MACTDVEHCKIQVVGCRLQIGDLLTVHAEKGRHKQECTVKPAHEVISIKQSPVLKGHLFLVQSLEISYELNLFQEVTYFK